MAPHLELGHHSLGYLAFACIAWIVVGCGSVTTPSPTPSPTPVPSPTLPPPYGPAPRVQGQSLRLVNTGPTLARKLTVVFPDARVDFGDVVVGVTTAYQPIPNGVYRYAAYHLEIDGAIVSQPVIDWVGEQPMEGREFTYTISVDTARPRYQWVRLVSVSRDE